MEFSAVSLLQCSERFKSITERYNSTHKQKTDVLMRERKGRWQNTTAAEEQSGMEEDREGGKVKKQMRELTFL